MISVNDKLPEDYEDKSIKLSDGSIHSGYFDVKSKTWCSGMPIPLLSKNDSRTVTHWDEKGGFDSMLLNLEIDL